MKKGSSYIVKHINPRTTNPKLLSIFCNHSLTPHTHTNTLITLGDIVTHLAQVSRYFIAMLPRINPSRRCVTIQTSITWWVCIIWCSTTASATVCHPSSTVLRRIRSAQQHHRLSNTLFLANRAKLIRLLFQQLCEGIHQHKHRVVHQSSLGLDISEQTASHCIQREGWMMGYDGE